MKSESQDTKPVCKYVRNFVGLPGRCCCVQNKRWPHVRHCPPREETLFVRCQRCRLTILLLYNLLKAEVIRSPKRTSLRRWGRDSMSTKAKNLLCYLIHTW